MVVDDIAPASGQDRRPSRLDPTIAAYACAHPGMRGPIVAGGGSAGQPARLRLFARRLRCCGAAAAACMLPSGQQKARVSGDSRFCAEAEPSVDSADVSSK